MATAARSSPPETLLTSRFDLAPGTASQRKNLPVTAVAAIVAILSVVAVGRIVLTYRGNSQAFDEPCHVAAGIEFLDRHTYTLDPVHPPLSRIAIALPLYLAGERYPATGAAATSDDYNVVGNAILQDSGHYLRNLILARLGVLPFLLLAIFVVFIWSRQQSGDLGAILAVALFTTLPTVLAFSSIAYSDMAAAATQLTGLFMAAKWIERPKLRSSVLLALALGLALLSKATTLLFLPAGMIGMLLAKRFLGRKELGRADTVSLTKQIAHIMLIASAVVWGGYGFSLKPVQQGMALSPNSMPSFQSFPGPVRGLARKAVMANPLVPAPELIKGLATAWTLNRAAPPAYLLGKIKPGGWWYFFLVGIAVKSPLPFLVLFAVGMLPLTSRFREGGWAALAPAICAIAILAVTMPLKYNAGLRHVLVLFPLLAIIAGTGGAHLWRMRGRWGVGARAAVVLLLAGQAASTVRAQRDFLAYFNEFAGKDPSKVLVAGCDLDCGQDVFRLQQALRDRRVAHVSLAIWTSTDMSRMGLPEFDTPAPYAPARGWFAISLRALRFGDLFHTTYPADAFEWLSRYKPVSRIGSTILLYYIPQDGNPGRTTRSPRLQDSVGR